MNWRRALIPLLVVLPFLLLFASRFGVNPNKLPSVLVGRPAPAFSLQTVNGQELKLENYRGKPLLINFWSTWCVPCKVEHDILQEGAKRYGDAMEFVGIVYQDSLENTRNYLAGKIDRYPQLMDPDASVAIQFGVSGVPESFFIDENGIVQHKQVGVVTPDILVGQLRSMIQARGDAK